MKDRSRVDGTNKNIQVIKANLRFFKAKAADYNKEEPSYRPENIRRVTKILKDCLKNKPNPFILDIGCGTGFIIDIAKRFSKNIIGVDISPEMLKEVNRDHMGINLSRTDTTHLPFVSNCFDLCTSYGFLHHLYDMVPTLQEAYRCLKKNGVFYSDQDPNFYFWSHAKKFDWGNVINEIPKAEIIHVNDPTVGYKQKNMKSLDLAGRDTILKAEYQKTSIGGFKEEEMVRILKKIGFRKISYEYEWYLGESYVKHNVSPHVDKKINEHMKRCLPLTRDLFKYVRIVAVK